MYPLVRLALPLALGLLALASAPLAQSTPQAQPDVPGVPPTRKLLFLTHAGCYKHTSLGPAERAVMELGKANGYAVTTVEGYKIWSVDPVFRAHVNGGIRWSLGMEQ